MKVLLLHPDDAFPLLGPKQHWDLIVDFARAPADTYKRWSKQAMCPLFSLSEFAEEVEDLGRVRQILQRGTGCMVDQQGIDWWDVLSLELVPQLQQIMLVHRLSQELNANCELYSSRRNPLATALQRLLGARLTILETRVQAVIRRARDYRNVFARLENAQLAQVVEDKFEIHRSIRSRFTRRPYSSGRPVILLPSAYVNVSRTAASYAQLLPDHKFLLVYTRSDAKLTSLPANVRFVSLAPYFVPSDKQETASLLDSWNSLRKQLVDSAEEFSTADTVGVLGRIPALLPWGIALRNAWGQVFESENVTACLSADDANPPSNIPLVMARNRGLPSIACHHGALNYMFAIKANHADSYLVKNEMERDYMKRICDVAPKKMFVAALSSSKTLPTKPPAVAPWLVYFTEPYDNGGWRTDEVYRDILPYLYSLARSCDLKLVFKLHPFETVKGHRRMLRRLIPEYEHQIEVLAGPASDQLWSNVQFALTVQSSTALECSARGIPVFLCAWLRDAFSGYVQQYARFGVGQVLESAEQIADIPRLIAGQREEPFEHRRAPPNTDSRELGRLFSGADSLAVASNA